MILAVSKDPGGTNGLLPVVKILRDNLGHDVKLIANGSAAGLLKKMREIFEVFGSPEEVRQKYSKPAALITSICSNGGLGRDLVPLFRGACPVIGLHDFWGSHVFSSWRDSKFWPDFFLVNDELDAQITLEAWPNYSKSQIIITGYPIFDQYKENYNKDCLLNYSSRELGVDLKDKSIVLFACGITKGASQVLREVVEALNFLDNNNLIFIPRFHPLLEAEAPEEFELIDRELKKFHSGILISDSSSCNTQTLIRIATVVLSEFSTTLLEAALVRKPNISICYPNEVKNLYRTEFGKVMNLMPDPPFVMWGCTAKANDKISLARLISSAIKGELNLQDCQEKYFPVDGRNAFRAARFISSVIS